jgi:hypothetical protein
MATDKNLSLKQEKFCQLYASDSEFFWNGVQSYIEAYNPDRNKKNWYNTACATVSEILTNPKVCERINEILEEKGLSDNFADKQLLFLMTQHQDKWAKMRALEMFYKINWRVEKNLQKALDNKQISKDVIPQVQVTIQANQSNWTVIE